MDTKNVNVFDFEASTLELHKEAMSEMKKRPDEVDNMPCQ